METKHHPLENPDLEQVEYVPRFDTGYHAVSTLSSPVNCPSLIDGSFDCHPPTSVLGHGSRKSSVASWVASNSPGWSSARPSNPATPTTPDTTGLLPLSVHGQGFKNERDVATTHVYTLPTYELPHLASWHENLSPSMSMSVTHGTTMHLRGVFGTSGERHAYSSYGGCSQSMGMNPVLSRPIFGPDDMMESCSVVHDTANAWSEPTHTPIQTIAPSAAFQPIMSSSPSHRHDPLTPLRTQNNISHMLNSSPCTLLSPPVLPSQHDIDDDFQYDVTDHVHLFTKFGGNPTSDIDTSWGLASTPDRFREHPMLHRRGYERKRLVGPSYKPKSAVAKSGINCEAVIPQNEFACSFDNCVDKATGSQKRFKRLEHKKRHENTVHLKVSSHKCWVPDCKTGAFTRTDNLRSHLEKTHGKKSPNQRNRYVATQDKNSKFYDPDWRGDLDKDGFPIFASKM